MILREQQLFTTFMNAPRIAVEKITGKRGKDTIKYPRIHKTG